MNMKTAISLTIKVVMLGMKFTLTAKEFWFARTTPQPGQNTEAT